MRVFVCTDHDGHYVGVASVVVARDEAHACELLDEELMAHSLQPSSRHGYALTELDPNEPKATILQDGDY